jgi:hypothetical protein
VRAVDLAHPARAEQGHELVAADRSARHERGDRGGSELRGLDECRPFEERLRRIRLAQQRLDLPSQVVVVGTGVGEKGRARLRIARESRVIQLLDPLPALRRHVNGRASPAAARPSQAATLS